MCLQDKRQPWLPFLRCHKHCSKILCVTYMSLCGMMCVSGRGHTCTAQHTCGDRRTALGVGAHPRQGLPACCSRSGTLGLLVCRLLRILAFPPPSSLTDTWAWLYTDAGNSNTDPHPATPCLLNHLPRALLIFKNWFNCEVFFVCVSVYTFTGLCVSHFLLGPLEARGGFRSQEYATVSYPMGVLETSSGRVASTFNHWATSPALPPFVFLKQNLF